MPPGWRRQDASGSATRTTEPASPTDRHGRIVDGLLHDADAVDDRVGLGLVEGTGDAPRLLDPDPDQRPIRVQHLGRGPAELIGPDGRVSVEALGAGAPQDVAEHSRAAEHEDPPHVRPLTTVRPAAMRAKLRAWSTPERRPAAGVVEAG